MDLNKFVSRRLHPIRVTVSLLNHELELAKSETEVTINRDLLESVISTVEIFVEDWELAKGRFQGTSGDKASERNDKGEKKFVETAKTTVKV